MIGCHKPNFFTDFFNELGIAMTPIICNFLGAKERLKVRSARLRYKIKNQQQWNLCSGLHRFFSFDVAVEDKSLQHHPQVCTMDVLEIMFSAWAYIEVTCCVPFLKSYKPVTEVVSAKLK